MTVRWTVRAAEPTEQGCARGENEALLHELRSNSLHAPQVRFISKTYSGAMNRPAIINISYFPYAPVIDNQKHFQANQLHLWYKTLL